MHEVIGFDIETAAEAQPKLEDNKITCAAAWSSSTGKATVWHGALVDGRYADSMAVSDVKEVIAYLAGKLSQGAIVVTWNGAGFDWPILMYQGQSPTHMPGMCLEHVDVAFHMLCVRGFMCGLEAASKGMGLGGKSEEQGGCIAPILWRKTLEDQRRVLRYVARDAQMTAQIYQRIQEEGYLTWIAGSGKRSTWDVGRAGLLTVADALELPLPNTSWMDKPRTRESILRWMNPESATAAEPSPDRTRLDGDLLILDPTHSRASQVGAIAFAATIEKDNPGLAQQVRAILQ